MQYVIFRVFCKSDPLFISVCSNKEQLEDVVLNKLDKYVGEEYHCKNDEELFAIVEVESGTCIDDISDLSASSCEYPDYVIMGDSLDILKKKIKGEYKSDDEEEVEASRQRKASTDPKVLFYDEYINTLATNLKNFEKTLEEKNLVRESKEWKNAIKEHDEYERVIDPMKGLFYNHYYFNRAWDDRKGL